MKCGDCTLCCKLLRVDDLEKKMWEDCEYRCETKCSIYKARPQNCRDFECAYYQMEKVSEDLRPDKCGMIFERFPLKDDLFIGTQDPDRPMSEVAKKQIAAFNKQGFNVLVQQKNGPTKLYNRSN